MTEKHFIPKLSVKTAKDENEVSMIEIYNAAKIGAVKKVNHKEFDMSREDVEDASSDAAIKAILGADMNGAYRAYGSTCGANAILDANDENIKRSKMFESYESGERYDKGQDTITNRYDKYLVDRKKPDSKLIAKELKLEKAEELRLFMKCFDMLPEKDKILFLGLANEESYESIAKRLGCTVNSLYKRHIDGRERMLKLMREERDKWSYYLAA